eukprot:1158122-Pelagomonas_calceolata.AAC.24
MKWRISNVSKGESLRDNWMITKSQRPCHSKRSNRKYNAFAGARAPQAPMHSAQHPCQQALVAPKACSNIWRLTVYTTTRPHACALAARLLEDASSARSPKYCPPLTRRTSCKTG